MSPFFPLQNHGRRICRKLLATAGSSMIEVLVALALLIGVLVPASALVVRLVTQDPATRSMEALVRAETALEEAIASSAADPVTVEDGPWRVERRVRRDGRLHAFRVDVYRGAKPDPVLSLQTTRYRP